MTAVTTEKKKSSYLKEVHQELRKVTWTSKEELIFGTRIVIIATFLFSFAIYGVDFVIRGVLNGMSALFQMVFG